MRLFIISFKFRGLMFSPQIIILQLHTLSTFFNANPRPDALMKEQLVEMTGLSPRVIRVWFQNKRCKHNKKTNALKIQMEQEKVVVRVDFSLQK